LNLPLRANAKRERADFVTNYLAKSRERLMLDHESPHGTFSVATRGSVLPGEPQ